jgi:hypothetical protein
MRLTSYLLILPFDDSLSGCVIPSKGLAKFNTALTNVKQEMIPVSRDYSGNSPGAEEICREFHDL